MLQSKILRIQLQRLSRRMENGGWESKRGDLVNRGNNFVKAFALTVSSQKDEKKFFQEKNQELKNSNVVVGLRKAQIQKSHFFAPEVSEF